MDVWGEIYLDQWEGRSAPHFIERDDGLVHGLEFAADYFKAPRSEAERLLLDRLAGPVLDLGCGVGSYTLYLQQRGLDVTAGDASPGAIRVCQARGCRDARLMDVRSLDLPAGRYGAIIIMGNTLGIHQTPATLPGFLRALRAASVPGARLGCVTLDPLATDDPAHLAYHRRNTALGRPPGLTTIRMKYRDMVDDWAQLWLPTTAELAEAFAGSGWILADRQLVGATRVDCYEASGTAASAG